MQIIIVGAGKVGFALAANLCKEGHDVTVIDNNRLRLEIMEDHLNINSVLGNAARVDTLKEAGVEETDLMIAVTDKDELNMMTCFVGKSLGAKSTVARVRTPGYSDFDNAERLHTLGIDLLINPEKVTAQEIIKLIEYPQANYVGLFAEGQVLLMEVTLDESCTCLNKTLLELAFPVPCILVAIDRSGQLLIPRGHDCLQAGDELLLLTRTSHMPEMEKFLNIHSRKTRDVLIVSGGLSGFYLAEMLNKSHANFHVKVMDPNLERCEEMASTLQDTVVIHMPNSGLSVFEEENIGEVDVFVATSGDDKDNVFDCVLAKRMGAKKTIAQIRGSEYTQFIQKMGLDAVVSPNMLTADKILSFINRKRILSLTRFEEGAGQITEYFVPRHARAVGKKLMDLDFPRDAIICMLIRGKRSIIPGGQDSIEAGDVVLVFSLPEAIREVEKLLTQVEV